MNMAESKRGFLAEKSHLLITAKNKQTELWFLQPTRTRVISKACDAVIKKTMIITFNLQKRYFFFYSLK